MKSNLYHNKFNTMGTRCQILISGVDTDYAAQVFNIIKKDVTRLEEDLSHFNEQSEVSQINKWAASSPVPVSEAIFDLIKACRKYYDLTRGLFDITQKPLVNFWSDKTEGYSANGEVEKLISATGMNNVVLNETDHTVLFKHKKLKIDFSGIGKGYALERVKKLFRRFSVKNAFVSLGESTILALGTHPEGDHWKISMKNYYEPDRNLHTFLVRDGALSTTSNFYSDSYGKLYARPVVDPKTGYPVRGLKSVSVCSGSAMLVEVLSNAFLLSNDSYIKYVVENVERIDAIKTEYESGKAVVRRFCTEVNKSLN